MKLFPFLLHSTYAKTTLLSCILLGIGGTSSEAWAQSVVYVSSVGNDQNNGSQGSPLRTLDKALKQLALASGGTVNVTQGKFEEPMLTVPANVSINGGWSSAFDTQKKFSHAELAGFKLASSQCPDNPAFTCVTTKVADRVMSINAGGVSLAQMVVVGPDRSGVAGSNSYSLVVDGVGASLNGIVVAAGKGGPGLNGSSGQVGSGFCSSGGAGGRVGRSGDLCAPQVGNAGQSISYNGRVANGGAPGGIGSSNCSVWSSISGITNGGTGGQGDQGIEGKHGEPVIADNGAFARSNGILQWVSLNTGGNASAGSSGGGGGGGGPGGSWNIIYWTGAGYVVAGGHGHVGNGGGCGGQGGSVGNPGGAAIGLVVNTGKVDYDNLVLLGGNGGKGGTGGNGNIGAVGGADTSAGSGGTSTNGPLGWGPTSWGGTGGIGGVGGKGGGGGGGAGGVGGAAITLALVNKGVLHQAGGSFWSVDGAPGGGGDGGKGADSLTTAPGGNLGVVLQKAELTLR